MNGLRHMYRIVHTRLVNLDISRANVGNRISLVLFFFSQKEIRILNFKFISSSLLTWRDVKYKKQNSWSS